MHNVKVVVTGLGIVSSIGIGKVDFWNSLVSGKSGITDVSGFDTKEYRTHRGAEVKDFNPSLFMNDYSKKGRATQFLIAAFSMALKDSGINLDSIEKDMVSVIAGTTMAEAQVIEEISRVWFFDGMDKIGPAKVLMSAANNIPDSACFKYGLMGMSITIPAACSAGNYAIGCGYDMIKQSNARVVFACTSDAFSRIGFAGFNRLLSMAPDTCRPFDKNRKGMIIGEGSAVLVMENEKDAKNRGAPIYAEVAGYGLSCDAFSMTAPNAEGIERVMKAAISNSGIGVDDIDYVSAHGTGTYSNDRVESQAIKKVFGRKYINIPVSSIKSMIGHTMGSSSSMEAVSCCMAIKNSVVPPTMNYLTPDPECDLDCVPNKARKKRIDIAMNNSYAFGGNNCSVIFKRH
jgi:3-oxoacyl-[acyl-carrier-protein] synthase II